MDSTGIIKSPNYPSNYPASDTQTYNLAYDMGKLIHIIFEDFKVENKHDCGYDSLTFYDYIDGKYVQARKMCGISLPGPFTSKSNKMRIVFYSDHGRNLRGFKLNYIVIDAQEPAPPSGSLHLHYMNTLKYEIKAT